MGASQSSGVELGGGPMGYQVLRVYPDSPGSKAGLKAYFDFIVAIGTTRFSKEDGSLREILKASVDQKLKMIVFNTRSKSAREVDIVPSNSWGGSGLLGVSIKHSSFERADERVWHVVAVDPGSPAQQAGFKANEDYVIGSDSILQENDDLYNLIEAHEGKALKLFVYNTTTDNCREVVCHPNSRWGGRGYLGCEFGHGLLHRIPYADDQQQTASALPSRTGVSSPLLSGDKPASVAQPIASYNNSSNQQQQQQIPQQHHYQQQHDRQPQSNQPLNNSSMFAQAQGPQQGMQSQPQAPAPVQPGNQMFQQALFANMPSHQPMPQQTTSLQQQQQPPPVQPPQLQQGPPPQQGLPAHQQPPGQVHQQLPPANQYHYGQMQQQQQHYPTWGPPPAQQISPQQHLHQYTPQPQVLPQLQQQQTLLTQLQQQPLPPPPSVPQPPTQQQQPASSDKLPVAHTFAQLASVGAAVDHSQDLPT